MDKPRVLIIDDERHIRELLETSLGNAGYDVRSAPDGPLGLTVVKDWHPEVIVLDVMMPKIDGISLLPMLRRFTEAPVIMLSAKGDVEFKVSGLVGGADDYLSKPFDLPELDARIIKALRRPKLAYNATLRYHDLVMDVEKRQVERGEKRVRLSRREFDLLECLLRQPQRVFTRDQLLELVWGTEKYVAPGTVETYISYLRAKIDQDVDDKLIQTIRGVGYSLRGPGNV